MPNIVLLASNGSSALTLSNFRRERGGGAQFNIAVSSHGYAGNASYPLEPEELSSLISQLTRMYEACDGAAELRLHYEETHVKFELDSRGRLLVGGLLIRDQEPQQRLEFAFYSDQSCLPDFIAGLKSA